MAMDDKTFALERLQQAFDYVNEGLIRPTQLITNPAYSNFAFGEFYDDLDIKNLLKNATTQNIEDTNDVLKEIQDILLGRSYEHSNIKFESAEDFRKFENMFNFQNEISTSVWKNSEGTPIKTKEDIFNEIGNRLRRNGKTEHYVANKLKEIQSKAKEFNFTGFDFENLIEKRKIKNIEEKRLKHIKNKNEREEWIKHQRIEQLEKELERFPKDSLEYNALKQERDNLLADFTVEDSPWNREVLQLNPPKEGAPMFEGLAVPSDLVDENSNVAGSNTIESRRNSESNPQLEVLNNTNDIDLDELNKQWYENKQKEFAERELEIQKEFSDVNTLKPEDVIGDTVEETIENTAETVVKSAAGEVIEETGEKIIKEVTGINVELDGLNKKKTPKKLKKGTGKYKAKTSTINNEIYDRLNNSRYWAVDFPGSNGDFAVHGPNGTKRLEKEKIDQQRRKRKYEQTRQKYERKQQQRQQQKQKEFVDNTIHIDDEIDLDEINKQWYESKQKEFEQRQKEIDDYFENNADIDPEDVLKDDYEPDINKFTDDIDTLEKNFEQSKDFNINKGIDDALDAANKTVESTVREGGSISKYLKEFSNMGFFDKVQTLGAAAGAVSEYKNARRQGHGVVSSVARAGVDFALGEAMGLYYPLFLLAKEAPGMIVKGSEMLYKENRKMNSMANQQIFGGAQFQDTQQLATMRQSGSNY